MRNIERMVVMLTWIDMKQENLVSNWFEEHTKGRFSLGATRVHLESPGSSFHESLDSPLFSLRETCKQLTRV